jgi:hypothetical protein
VKDIITSKTFDNGVICASEQSIIVERCIYDEVHRELEAQGAYFMNESEAAKMAALLLRPNGTINPKVVGKTALYLSQMAGFCVPASTGADCRADHRIAPTPTRGKNCARYSACTSKRTGKPPATAWWSC